MFENLLGNEPIKKYLERALLQNALPQTLLFSGPDGVGKALFAKELASHLADPLDIHLLAPEGKAELYAIDSLREMMTKEHERPFGKRGKCFILSDADRMQPAAANALLKTLEEPTAETTFILLSSKPQMILPTILSRAVVCKFQPIPIPLIEERVSPHFAHLSGGSLGKALALSETPALEEQRELLFSLLRAKPSYPVLNASLEKLDEANPDLIFGFILMWHRDQHLRSEAPQLRPFFPNEPMLPLSPLSKVESAIEKARFSIERNMKLSQALRLLFNL